jgi:HEAT repeat protein
MGHEASPAIPALSNLLINLREAGADPAVTLANIGENGLPVLFEAATNKDRTVRYCAVNGLQFEKVNSREVVAILSKALKDSDLGVRLQAVASLESLNGQRELRMSALREAAKDPSLSAAANLAIKEMTDGIEGVGK